MQFKTVLFDFDGTLFDTVEGITNSIRYALHKQGMQEPPEGLRCFAGPPLTDKFMELYGVSRAEAEQLVKDFRERYVPIGVYESSPFPGGKELLQQLRAAGLTVGVATSKPQDMAELLLRRSEMLSCFDVIVGSDPRKSDDSKTEVVARALALCGGGEQAVLVGDTKYDVAGATANGIPCVGVRWGYAAPGELEAAGAVWIVEDMQALAALLLEGQ